jgi:hypothetical protein
MGTHQVDNTDDLDNLDIDVRLGDDPSVCNRCLDELQKIKALISERHEGRNEVFDLGLEFGQSRRSREERLERLTRTCVWHAIALKTEFSLKLLHTIDGYLAAADAKNPISTLLLARYLIELVATVGAIECEIAKCMDITLDKWAIRAVTFVGILYRARHSTSDPKFASILADLEIPLELTKPIHVLKALKILTSRPGFGSVKSTYDTLSNMCHHNGSGHKLLTERVRWTDRIVTQHGRTLLLGEEATAMTMSYPADRCASSALGLTARPAWWSAKSAIQIIEELPETPFNNEDLSKLTSGRLNDVRPFRDLPEPDEKKTTLIRNVKVGRNDPCLCGSGKKYKLCCLKSAKDDSF